MPLCCSNFMQKSEKFKTLVFQHENDYFGPIFDQKRRNKLFLKS